MVGEAITSRFRMCYELGGGLFNAGVLCCLVRIGMYKQTLGMFGRREESNIIMFEIFPSNERYVLLNNSFTPLNTHSIDEML